MSRYAVIALSFCYTSVGGALLYFIASFAGASALEAAAALHIGALSASVSGWLIYRQSFQQAKRRSPVTGSADIRSAAN